MTASLQATVTEPSSLELEDGQKLTVLLPGAVAGDRYVLTVQPEAEAKLSRDALARALLNELLADGPPAAQ